MTDGMRSADLVDPELAELVRQRDRLRRGLASCVDPDHREKVALQLEATERWIARFTEEARDA